MKQTYPKLIAVLLLLPCAFFMAGNDSRAVSPLSSPVAGTKANAAPDNPKFVYASRGASQIGCVDPSDEKNKLGRWLDVPSGFTAQGGAEIHCDLNPVLPAVAGVNKQLFALSLDKRGYLIGLYPRNPLLKPINVVFTIDPVQEQKICSTCFVGRYFDPVKKQWRNLPTIVNQTRSQVIVQINVLLPASGYPAYADRALIALFSKQA